MLLSELHLSEKKSTQTAWVIAHTADKLILGKRAPGVNNPNLWNFFGGHIEPGESAASAAAREMEEEAGLSVDPSDLKQVASAGDATYFTYKVSGTNGMRKTSEISKIEAFKLTDLPNNLHNKTQKFFDQLDTLFS